MTSKSPLGSSSPQSFSTSWKPKYPQGIIKESSWTPPPPAAGRGSKAAGLRFEREIGKILLRAKPEEAAYFFQKVFSTPDGLKIPDHYLLFPTFGIVYETKLTFKPKAKSQLLEYADILSSYYCRPFRSALVCRNLTLAAGTAAVVQGNALISVFQGKKYFSGVTLIHCPYPGHLAPEWAPPEP